MAEHASRSPTPSENAGADISVGLTVARQQQDAVPSSDLKPERASSGHVGLAPAATDPSDTVT
jgi:hypothetical protein